MKSEAKLLASFELAAAVDELRAIRRMIRAWIWWSLAIFVVEAVFWLVQVVWPWIREQSLKKP